MPEIIIKDELRKSSESGRPMIAFYDPDTGNIVIRRRSLSPWVVAHELGHSELHKYHRRYGLKGYKHGRFGSLWTGADDKLRDELRAAMFAYFTTGSKKDLEEELETLYDLYVGSGTLSQEWFDYLVGAAMRDVKEYLEWRDKL